MPPRDHLNRGYAYYPNNTSRIAPLSAGTPWLDLLRRLRLKFEELKQKIGIVPPADEPVIPEEPIIPEEPTIPEEPFVPPVDDEPDEPEEPINGGGGGGDYLMGIRRRRQKRLRGF